MFLSRLQVDVGDNPDRPRPGRKWLRNIYHVHQRLCMAFPSESRVERDRDFIQPFKPEDFDKQVHVARQADTGFLYRIDAQPGGSPIILVQSATEPNWDYAFRNATHFLAAPPQVQKRNPTHAMGQELRFRIRVNLSKKAKPDRPGTDLRKPRNGTDKKGRPKDQGKRVALTWEKGQNPEDVIREWFAKKTARAFQVRSCKLLHLGWVVGYKPLKKGKAPDAETADPTSPKRQDEIGDRAFRQIKLRSALLEGTLVVANAPAFEQVIRSGVGPAKAFGFGLLSVAPV